MQTLGTAKRVRIYVKEDDRSAGKLLIHALIEFLRSENAQGATVLRAIEGFGANGRVHGGSLVDVAAHLPVIVEWVDRPEAVERLMPRVLELVKHGLVTVDDTDVLFFEPHPVRTLRSSMHVSDVMSREVASVERKTPIRTVVELVLGKTYRAVPVTEDGRPVGIVTNTDLLARGGLDIRIDLLGTLDKPEVGEVLEHLSQRGHTAGEVMTASPMTVKATATLPEAAEIMALHRLKRLPVVDGEGKLTGIISRLDLLRAAAGGFTAKAPDTQELGLLRDEPVSRVMRRDTPVVHPETSFPDTFRSVISTRLNRAFVVDGEGRVVGLVSDAELLERITPSLRTSALRALMKRIPFVHPKQDQVSTHSRARTAGEVMSRAFVAVTENVLLSEAIARMLREGQKVLAVTDEGGRLVGIVDRADLLHGLIPKE